MRGIDTPVLLDLLRGRSLAKQLISSLRGDELGTTEINLFELEMLAMADGKAGIEHRRAAIERMRHRITVLPIDENAVRASGQLASSIGSRVSPVTRLILGTLLAARCTEWYTTSDVSAPGKLGPLRIIEYA